MTARETTRRDGEGRDGEAREKGRRRSVARGALREEVRSDLRGAGADRGPRRYPFLGILALGLLLAGLAAAPARADHAYVTCESDHHGYAFCPVDTRGGVELVDRLSRASCRYGHSWGVTRDGIWVDHGCRAEFVAYAGPVGDPYGDRDVGYGTDRHDGLLVCESHDQRFRHCPADTRFGVKLVEQRSRSRCRHGDSWGYDRYGVWVDHGCRAEFVLEGGHHRPGHPGPRHRAPRPRGHGGVHYEHGVHHDDGDDGLALVVGGAVLAGAVAAVIHGRNQAKNDEARALCHDQVERRIAAAEGRVDEVHFESADADKPRKGFRQVTGAGTFFGAGTRERFTYRCLVELESGLVREASYAL